MSVRALAPAIREVELAMEEPSELHFAAGQWVSVPFGPKTVRAYSIASPPRSSTRLELCADVAPAGLGSRWFRELVPGQEVHFKGPLGGFVFSRTDPRWPLLVAEEIGIVPIRAMLVDLYETGFGRPAHLVYYARDRGSRPYDAEFRSLERRYPGFSYHPVSEGEGPLLATVEELAGGVERERCVGYVAGGGETINRVREVLMARGLDRKSVKWERFW